MKKLLVIAILLGIPVIASVLFPDAAQSIRDNWMTRNMFVPAAEAGFDTGPAIGSTIPAFEASHRGQPVTDFASFSRSNGSVVIALRSLDWCPFCKKQIIQLEAYKQHFHAHGIGLLAVTYDSPEVHRAFVEQHGITIPLLSDPAASSFRVLGILNEQYQPGDTEYGIPYPGLIVIDGDGRIAGKLFVEDPELRVDSAEVLAFTKQILGIRSPFQ